MKKRGVSAGMFAGLAGALFTGVLALPAAAHHSFAMYDRTVTRTLTGKLTRFIPGANHAQLIFELVGPDGKAVPDESGRPVQWGVEAGSAADLALQGVTMKDFPIGTIITVTLNPLRDGRPFGSPDGQRRAAHQMWRYVARRRLYRGDWGGVLAGTERLARTLSRRARAFGHPLTPRAPSRPTSILRRRS